jgi:hypothetical protein
MCNAEPAAELVALAIAALTLVLATVLWWALSAPTATTSAPVVLPVVRAVRPAAQPERPAVHCRQFVKSPWRCQPSPAITTGCSRDWLKFKNPNASAVKREAEKEWGRGGWK